MSSGIGYPTIELLFFILLEKFEVKYILDIGLDGLVTFLLLLLLFSKNVRFLANNPIPLSFRTTDCLLGKAIKPATCD